MSELPYGWAEARFGEINSFSSQTLDPTKFPGERFELYSVPAFPSGQPESQLGAAIGSTKQLVAPDDVLICKINPRINRVWQVMPKKEHRQIASSEWIVLRSPGSHPNFLRYYFSSPDFREVICEGVTGVGGSLTRAQPKRVATFSVPIAPFNEQKRIADKLDTVLARLDSCRERLNRVPTILKRFRQAILAAASSGKLTEEWRAEQRKSEEWPTVRLTDVGEIGRGKSKHRPRNDPRLYGGPYPFIQTGDVAQSGGRITTHTQTYSEFGLAQSKLWPAGTVCITIAANIADTAILEYPACFPDSVVGFVAAPKKSLPEFIKWSIDVISDRLEAFAPATAQKNINLAVLNDVEFRCPQIDEQIEIVHRVEALFAYADRLEARYTVARTQVERLTPALLAKAFRGELVPQDPSDEPASVLVERIRAARAAAGATTTPGRRKGSGPKTPWKAEVLMLTRKDVQGSPHLTTILKERGPLTAEALWSASQLDIDDFYDQLKDEEARGLLREKRGDASNAPRMLEAA